MKQRTVTTAPTATVFSKPDPSKLPDAWVLIVAQIIKWRKDKRTDAWIKTQPVGNLYFILGGK